MVSLLSLWLPILLAAVLVFIVSSIIHMALRYHHNDYVALPNEEQARSAIRPLNIPPGEYMVPKPASPSVMSTPEFTTKLSEGPVMALTVFPNGPFTMGKQLVQWFLYSVVVGVFAGYLASRTLPAGAEYMAVFRVTGTVAFAAYGLALLQASIWFGRRWSTTLKSVADALVYALLTAGTFGAFWPS